MVKQVKIKYNSFSYLLLELLNLQLAKKFSYFRNLSQFILKLNFCMYSKGKCFHFSKLCSQPLIRSLEPCLFLINLFLTEIHSENWVPISTGSVAFCFSLGKQNIFTARTRGFHIANLIYFTL